MAKDFKLMGEAYLKVRSNVLSTVKQDVIEETGTQQPAPVTSAGVTAGVSDSTSSDQAKVAFDSAATAYFKAMGVDDTNIKKFLDSTHAQLNGFKGTGAPNLGAQQTAPAAPAAATAAAPTQFGGGRGFQPSTRPSWASK